MCILLYTRLLFLNTVLELLNDTLNKGKGFYCTAPVMALMASKDIRKMLNSACKLCCGALLGDGRGMGRFWCIHSLLYPGFRASMALLPCAAVVFPDFARACTRVASQPQPQQRQYRSPDVSVAGVVHGCHCPDSCLSVFRCCQASLMSQTSLSVPMAHGTEGVLGGPIASL